MCWKCDKLRTTSLRTTEASVHKCNGDKSVHDLTQRETERETERASEKQRETAREDRER